MIDFKNSYIKLRHINIMWVNLIHISYFVGISFMWRVSRYYPTTEEAQRNLLNLTKVYKGLFYVNYYCYLFKCSGSSLSEFWMHFSKVFEDYSQSCRFTVLQNEFYGENFMIKLNIIINNHMFIRHYKYKNVTFL